VKLAPGRSAQPAGTILVDAELVETATTAREFGDRLETDVNLNDPLLSLGADREAGAGCPRS
jgi:hypothetical protein